MTSLFLAARLPLSQLMVLGVFALMIVTAWSYSHWRTAVKAAFVLALVEGAIRKWVFPQGQELAYFLKDIVLVGAYLKFFFAPDLDVRGYRLKVSGAVIVTLSAVVCFAAFNPNIGSVLLAAYGVKVYFYYLPLVFMMPYLFRTQEEMVRQLTWFALLAIPICLLGLAQWRAGPFSALNVYAQQATEGAIAEHGATGFGFGDRSRITGTFSYITGHSSFVVFFGALSVALLSMRETPRKWVLIWVVLPLLAANALMGGSRAPIFVLGLLCVGFVLASVTGRVASNRQFVTLLVAGMITAVGAAVYMFDDALRYWTARYEVSGDSVKGRIISHPVAALEAGLEEGGFGGLGIGLSHPATDAIRRALKIPDPQRRPPRFDNELGQVLVELGMAGFIAWYLIRFVVVWWAWQAYLRSPPGPIRALCLAAILVAGPHLIMSVVLNHTANILLAGMLGLALIPKLEPTVQRRLRSRQPARALGPGAPPDAKQPSPWRAP